MNQKSKKLYNAIKKFIEETRTEKSISVIPYGLIGYKNIIIQHTPFLEIKRTFSWLHHGCPIKGAKFILFYPKNNLEVTKHLMGQMVMLIENDIPFIVMPYNGIDWLLQVIDLQDAREYFTEDPLLFLERLKEICEQSYKNIKRPKNALSDNLKVVVYYIEKKAPIPEDMKPSPYHEKYSLQGE